MVKHAIDRTHAKPAKAKGEREDLRQKKDIKILGVGVSEDDERFLKVAVGEKTALLNVDNIADSRSGELKILTRLGEPLIKPQARAEFLGRAHDAAREEPTLKVVTKTGWRDGKFVLPLGLAPEGEANIERYFDGEFAQYHRRLRRAGTINGWLKLADSCRGKSRLIAALCLQFSGPVCGALGYEPPSLQLVYRGGFGMTTIGRVSSTVWGGDPNLARKIGCGVSWNNTTNKLEVVAAAFNQMLLYLDDMHNAGEAEIKAIFNIMNGEGRGRLKELQQSFSLSVFSTSNRSIVKIAKRLKLEDEMEALIDRLPEVSLPEGCRYFFEGIDTPEQFRAYGDYVRDLACKNHGWAGPEFLARFERHLETCRAFIEAFAKKRQEAYFRASKAITSAGARDLTRVGNKFATIYVSGCLASHFKILPFSEAEVLEALLTCHRDHVAFIDRELGYAPARTISAVSAQGAATGPAATHGVAAPATTPFDLFQKFMNKNRKTFIDARTPADELPRHKPKGYVLYEDDEPQEYWIFNEDVEKVVGGESEAHELKIDLEARRLISTTGKGEKRKFVVKRQVPGQDRPYVMAVLQKARSQ